MLGSLFSLAATLEASAALMIAANQYDPFAITAVVLTHGLASTVIALAVWITLPAGMRQPKYAMLSLLFLSNLFVQT